MFAKIIIDTHLSPSSWNMIQKDFPHLLGAGTEINTKIGEVSNRNCNHACLEKVSLMPFARRVLEAEKSLKRLPLRVWCSCCGERERVFILEGGI